jgi:hypothetical protein
VHGRVDHGHLGGGRSGEGGGGAHVLVEDVFTGDFVVGRPRKIEHIAERNLVDLFGDVPVDGGDDLRPVVEATEVDLVPVVGRGVVTRGHHDTGADVEVPHGEGQHGGRQQAGQQDRTHTGTRHDLGGVGGEDLGVVASVVADHNARRGPRSLAVGGRLCKKVSGESGGGLGDKHPVHPV